VKAIVIHEHGGIDKLKFEDVPKPEISSKEVLIEVKAASLNHLDIWVRQGIPGAKLAFPHILGSDGAGIVAEVSEEVKTVKKGDKVLLNPGISCGNCEWCLKEEQSECSTFHLLGEHINGTFAEFVKAPEGNVHPIPEHLTFSEAAAFPLVFLTAWRLLITKAKIKPGEVILILGIGGGVASAALQIAKSTGLKAIVTSSSSEKLKKAKGFGADEIINYSNQDFAGEVRSLTDKKGVDVVLDNVGAKTWQESLKSLKKGGRLVTCGATTGPNPPEDIQRIFWNQLTIFGSTMGNRREFKEVLQFMDSTKIKPVIDKVFPLEKGADAQKYMEEGKQFGKIVLTV
jgi:NADPH:quinone reductase-like Zn-dependent oxidoreductase